MIKYPKFIFLTLLFLFTSNVSAMIDNRYLPLYRQMFNRYCDRPSAAGTNVFFLIASNAFGDDCDNKEIGLFELNGKYDLAQIAKALVKVGKPNPLESQESVSSNLVLDLDGKLEGQGFWFGGEYNFAKSLSLGYSIFLLHLVSRQQFTIPDKLKQDNRLSVGNEIQLDRDLRRANDELGIQNFQYNATGVSDIDLYLRWGVIRDYYWKFRKIDFGVSLGTLIPSGMNVLINNPASISFGGNGHYGLYGMIDLNLELKEDLSVGFWFEILKRFKKTRFTRMPVNDEPVEFGALCGPARIEPGLTVGFSPYVALADIRDGFGFKVRYTLVSHEEDDWIDLRKNVGKNDKKLVSTTLGSVIDRSDWAAEYFTFTLMYDFAKGAAKPGDFAPIIYLEWDRPSKLVMANNVAKTNRVSFGFEFSF